MNPANYQKAKFFFFIWFYEERTFVRFLSMRVPPAARSMHRKHTRLGLFPSLNAPAIFIYNLHAGPIKSQLDDGRLICKVRIVKSRLPRRRRAVIASTLKCVNDCINFSCNIISLIASKLCVCVRVCLLKKLKMIFYTTSLDRSRISQASQMRDFCARGGGGKKIIVYSS